MECDLKIIEWTKTHKATITHQHAVKWVLAVWEHVKTGNKTKRQSDVSDMFDNEQFVKFIEAIGDYAPAMNPDELTICFMYLSKLGIGMLHKTMNTLLDTTLRIMKNGLQTLFKFESLFFANTSFLFLKMIMRSH